MIVLAAAGISLGTFLLALLVLIIVLVLLRAL